MGACGHKHELLVEVVLPQELLSLAFVGGKSHVACYAIACHKQVSPILTLEDDLTVAAVDDAELGEVALVICARVIYKSVGSGVHGKSGGKVDDAESLSVRYVFTAVGLGLLDCEVVKQCIAAFLPLYVESEE